MVRNSEWFLNVWRRYFRFLGSPEKAPLPDIGRFADLVAPALLLGMAIGRIGDIVNGEHFAKFTTLPWGVIYSHGDSPAIGRPASHPAVGYELIFDLLIVAVLWILKDRLRPHGMVFVLALTLYAIGRFFISFLRVEANTYFGLNEAQIVCLAVLLVTIPLLVYKANWGRTTQM
jgi:phosphatidylglycerol:prolipoprotein diacylglycerol transferase